MCGVQRRPSIDDRDDLWHWKVGKGKVMRWREGHHVTFPGDWLSTEEKRRQTCGNQPSVCTPRCAHAHVERTPVLRRRRILCLLFFDGAVIVHKRVSVLILRVEATLSALVSGAQIAGWVVCR